MVSCGVLRVGYLDSLFVVGFCCGWFVSMLFNGLCGGGVVAVAVAPYKTVEALV
jgi:hypothetical protein